VTRLRQIMLEELRRRNYAESAIHVYIHTVEHFSRHFHRSPDQLGPEHIRQYQAALFTRWKLAPNTVTQRLAALRFFYVQVLKRGWSVAETPYPKKVLHLPASAEPLQRLLCMFSRPGQQFGDVGILTSFKRCRISPRAVDGLGLCI